MSGEDKAEASKQFCPSPFLGLSGTCRWWNFTAMVPLPPSARQPPPKCFYTERATAALFKVQSTAERLHSHMFSSPQLLKARLTPLFRCLSKAVISSSACKDELLPSPPLGLSAQPCTGPSSRSVWALPPTHPDGSTWGEHTLPGPAGSAGVRASHRIPPLFLIPETPEKWSPAWATSEWAPLESLKSLLIRHVNSF